jgi:probable O-glycosylation ligase (exosortase A-associated)
MRDIILVGAILIGLAVATAYPFSGVILWTWFAVQNPHQEAFSFSRELPLNFIIAAVTIFSWLLSRERKLPPNQFLIWAILIFLLWTTFNSFFSAAPDWSWQFWDRAWKTFALGLLIATMATTRVRIEAILWVVVLSLFYFGIKGGIFTLATGGVYKVVGPENTIIADNNQLALALLMGLPLANYFRRQTTNVAIKCALSVGMMLTLISVIGSYSRGAFLGLGALAIVGLLRTRRRLIYIAGAGIAAYGIAYFMPPAFWERIGTIQSPEADPSFHGREIAWQVAYLYARDHFPFGAGFYGPQLSSVFHAYFPGEQAHAAHSIFFQVLGEHGFIGLAIYLMILLGAFIKTFQIIRICRSRDDLRWLSDLGGMIQLSLFAFCVAGAALSMAYYDVFVICVSLLVPMSIICHEASRTTQSSFSAATAEQNLSPMSTVVFHPRTASPPVAPRFPGKTTCKGNSARAGPGGLAVDVRANIGCFALAVASR